MKLNLCEKSRKALEEITTAEDLNMEAADFYNKYLSDGSEPLSKTEIHSIMNQDRCTEEEAYYSYFLEAYDLDADYEEIKKIEKNSQINEMKKLDIGDYIENPYYQQIKPQEKKLNGWELVYKQYQPYQGFVYDDTEVSGMNFNEKTFFGYFPSFFRFLTAVQNGKVWMSITPHEINTMKEGISKAKGHICVYGLGLGYFPFMCALKEDVKQIDIIEKDQNIIDLFTSLILPQFPHQEKIKIIKDDAYHYAEAKMNKDKVDFAFVDLWHQPEDGLYMYLKMKRFEKINHGTEFCYWVEKSILIMMRRCLLILLREELSGTTDADYLKGSSPIDSVVNKMHFYLKDTVIDTPESLYTLLSDDSLKKIAYSLL
jgi:hypothetical protein